MKIEELVVRNIEFGKGIPKICVPIVESNSKSIISSAEQILEKNPDVIELRIDWFEKVDDTDSVLALLDELREILGNTVLLFTFRTKQEGGETAISVEHYRELCEKVCASGNIDLLDVEAFMQDGLLKEICDIAHTHGVYVVASNHDFEKTPEEGEIVRRLQYMDQHGADIPKIAVMPHDEADVLELLKATLRYRTEGGKKPIVTMSMKQLGLISRLSGEVFGSAMTFACVGQTSAPGQIAIDEVRKILSVLHNE